MRGLPAHELTDSTLWWQGPSWLPHKGQLPNNELTHPTEIRILNLETPPINIIKWERFSSYNKCLRVVAWICRYKDNLKKRVRGLAINTDPNLNVSTIRMAERIIINHQSKGAYAGGRVATPTLRRQAGGSLRPSLHAGPLPIPSISSHDLPTCSSHELRGRPLGLLHSGLSLTETTR